MAHLDNRVEVHAVDPTPLEIAELIWLRSRLPQTQRANLPTKVHPEDDLYMDQSAHLEQEKKPWMEPLSDEAEVTFAQQREGSASSRPSFWRQQTVALPASQPLDDPLSFSRALHHMANRSDDGPLVVNIAESVKISAATDCLQLFFERSTRRSTKLVIMRDRAGQMELWRDAIGQLTKLVEQMGSFADVQLVEADLSNAEHADFFSNGAAQRSISIESTVSTGAHHLYLLISDGIGDSYLSGALGRAFQSLPREASMVWVHVWPRSRWGRTATRRLKLTRTIGAHESTSATAVVPVVPFSPDALTSLGPWLMNRGSRNLLAVQLPTTDRRDLRSLNAGKLGTRSWHEYVRSVAGVVEPQTLEVLALAAAVPGFLDIPLLRAIGDAFCAQEVSLYHVAEAVSSGLLSRMTEHSTSSIALFQIADLDARNELLSYLHRDRVEAVLAFLLERYVGGASSSDVRLSVDRLQIPLRILFKFLRGETLDKSKEEYEEIATEGFSVFVSLRMERFCGDGGPEADFSETLADGQASVHRGKNYKQGTSHRARLVTKPYGSQSQFNPKYTFDRFVAGASNREAYDAAVAVTGMWRPTANPLFIFGGAGLGKTHLLHAIGNEIQKQQPSANVFYISTEQFINEFYQAIDKSNLEAFRKSYMAEAAVLLVDDIHHIIVDNSAQEEFVRILRYLFQVFDRQIVLSASVPPQNMQLLHAQLIQRIQSGAVVEIQLPEFDTTLALVSSLLADYGKSATPEAAKFIASFHQLNNCHLLAEFIGFLVQNPPRDHKYPDISWARDNLSRFFTEKGFDSGVLESPSKLPEKQNIENTARTLDVESDKTSAEEKTPPKSSDSEDEKPKLEKEHRHAPRAPIELKVDYRRLNTFFHDWCRNIGRGGTFIKTDTPLAVGTEFIFLLQIPTIKERLRLRGNVKWMVPSKDATEESPAGMGIQFTDGLDEETKRMVRELMEDSLGKHLTDKLLSISSTT